MKDTMLQKLKWKGFMEEYLPMLDNAIRLKCHVKLNNLEAVLPELKLICECYHEMKLKEEPEKPSVTGALRDFSRRFQY